MKTQTLLGKFSRGLVWNGLFYTVYKILSVGLSFALYHHLQPEEFSAWAMVHSLVFILLLWLDCGFRKSIPRYCPAFAKNKKTHRAFIQGLIIFQSILLITLGIPLLGYGLTWLTYLAPLTWYAFGIFFIEGMVALLRLVYHAHFWQKEFNLVHTACVTFEMMVNFYAIHQGLAGLGLIQFLLMTKIISGATVIGASFFMLHKLYKDKSYPGTQTINMPATTRKFIMHSGVMWAGAVVKSFSERNVLFPYLTIIIGSSSANLFKVVHDAALFFKEPHLKQLALPILLYCPIWKKITNHQPLCKKHLPN